MRVNSSEFKVEVLKTEEEKLRGLSGRESIPEDTVLLFVFEEEGFHGIWMKEMLFGIDIVWLDKDFYVVDYKKDVLPETFPDVFYPEEPAMYVVEGRAGLVESSNIVLGDNLSFY